LGASQAQDIARPVTVMSKDALAPGEPFVVICPIEGEIDDGVAVVVERAVAEAEGAEAIVFLIDTPGGRVDSAIDITSSIMGAPCKTIAYVQGMGAISAGALISYSCDSIIMAPGTNIGASTPIMMGAEASEAVNEKSMSFVRAKYRALGEEKGHNPLIGEGMVDNEIELYGEPVEGGGYRVYKVREGKIVDAFTSSAFTPPGEEKSLEAMERAPKGLDRMHAQVDPENVPAPLKEFFGIPMEKEEDLPEAEEDPEPFTKDVPSDVPESAELISAAGKLVTLTSSEARDFGLVPVLANSLDEVASYEGWPQVQRYKVLPNFTESLFAWLTSPLISGLLLMCGVGGLYLEVRTPGFGLPGIIGLFCLAILFGSNLVLGLAEWWDLAFITLGIILLMIELFYIPGFGVIGLGGIISLCVGLYLSFTRVPIPEYTWDYQRLSDAGQTMTVATVLLSIFVVVTWRYLPRTPMARWLVLADSQTEDAGYIVQTTEDESAVGLRGQASSYLRPAGRGRFEGKTYDVVTRGEFLDAGTPIEIIRVEGNRYVVTELKESS
jgi:membrane-bound serine protease (ClpP class)